MDEDVPFQSHRGKGSTPSVPHTGWRCAGIDDLDSDYVTCEMCEISSIRYAHTMQHDDYAETRTVGCVCAGHIELLSNCSFDRGSLTPTFIEPFELFVRGAETGRLASGGLEPATLR